MNPFSQSSSGSAADLGESRLIQLIREWLESASPPSPAGIGDDCAVFSPTAGRQMLVTTDPVLWGRHFDETVSPEEAAGKLFKRNLSDIAAMGGRPRLAVVSLLLPPSTSVDWLQRFHLGLRAASLRYEAPLAGGDVSETDGLLGACMTVVGETVAERALTRGGASAGDQIFVTGSLGGSTLGRHLSFEPRLSEGQWLAARPEVTAGIDISDGLAKDLPAIIPGGCEAELQPETIPLSEAARALAARSGRRALFHALCDGEDYELLVTVKSKASAKFLAAWNERFKDPLTRIGVMRRRAPGGPEDNLLRGLPPGLAEEIRGYEHLT